MKKFKLNIIMLLAVVFGLAAAFSVFYYLSSVKANYLEKGDYVPVAVASQYIPPKTQITAQMFTMQEIPARYINDEAMVDPGELVGQLTKAAIYKDEQILKSRVQKAGDPAAELTLVIPAGQRAVTVEVNDVSGLAGLLRPGDGVDVLVTFEGDGGGTLTSTFLHNIKVLAIGNKMDASIGSVKQDATYNTVTLAVLPHQAQQLVLATEKGSIRLALRSPADQAVVNIPSSGKQQLVR